MPQILQKHPSWKRPISPFVTVGTVIALVLFSSGALAAVPNVVVDSQLAPVGGLNGPQSIIVAPNNTYYVADAGNNRIQAYVKGVASTVSTGGFTLVNPQAVAVDSLGDLFIGDSPSSNVGRVIEALATNGVLNGTVNLVVMGGALMDVTALTVDTTPGSSTFNTLYIGDDISSTLFSVAAGSTTLVNLGIVGLPSNIFPTALLKDTAGNLFVGDLNSVLYEIPAGSTTASIYFVDDFLLKGPTGLALDPKGDLYVLALTSSSATPSQPVPENIVEIPGEDTSSAFRVPFTGIGNGSGIALDSLGNLYIADLVGSEVTELIYGSPAGLSEVRVNTVGPSVTFNYELNAPTTLRSFDFVSTGDTSTEIQDEGGTCGAGTYNDGSDGGPASPSDPFICQESFAAAPAFPGLRYGAINLEGKKKAILASTNVYSIGFDGESVVYPLKATAGATGIESAAGAVISGLDKKIYISNSAPSAAIYSTNGPNGKNLTPISTAPVTLSEPYGITINGAGDLYVADYGLAEVVVVPANTAIAPYAYNPGGLLQRPLSIAFDTNGNLFIGDAGPNGVDADSGTPGYLVEVPAGGGTPFKINTGAVTVIYPQGLAADPYTGDIYVADRGDVNTEDGAEVVHVVANGGPTSVVDLAGITDPVSIAFDPAESYYVLDQNASTITEVTPGGYYYTVPLSKNLFTSPLALAASPGTQNFIEVNQRTEDATGNLVYLNGNATSIQHFGTVTVGQQSSLFHVRLNNIGSDYLTLADPYITDTGDTSLFLLPQNSCYSGLPLSPASPCDQYYQFAPTAAGHVTATYTFHTNDVLNPTRVFELEGTGKK